MADPGPGQPSRQGSGQGSGGRPPPKAPATAPGPPTTSWDQPPVRAPRYSNPPPNPYYPPEPRTLPPPGRTATRPPVTPPAQRPRPPAGPVRPDGPRPDGVRPDGSRPDGARPDGAKADAAAAAGAAVAAPARRTKPVVRGVRSRRLVRRFDIWSVFKVSVIFYICVFVVMLVAGTVLWNVAAAFGVITDGEKLVRSLFALNTYILHPITAFLWGSVIAGAVCFLGVLTNVLAAVLYNLISDVVGGVQVIVVSDQSYEESV